MLGPARHGPKVKAGHQKEVVSSWSSPSFRHSGMVFGLSLVSQLPSGALLFLLFVKGLLFVKDSTPSNQKKRMPHFSHGHGAFEVAQLAKGSLDRSQEALQPCASDAEAAPFAPLVEINKTPWPWSDSPHLNRGEAPPYYQTGWFMAVPQQHGDQNGLPNGAKDENLQFA